MTKSRLTTAVLVVVVAMLFGACQAANPSPSPSTASAPPAASEAPSSEAPSSEAPGSAAPPAGGALPTVPTGYAELDQALGADKPFNGKRVTIQTQWIGGEGVNFDTTVAAFEEATGIDVVQESIASQHEVVLRTRIDGGTPPDLAMLAQPSAVVAYGDRGAVVDATTFIDPAKLNAEFESSLPNITGDGGEVWGIPFKVDVKSTIWYPIKAFENAGYAVPTTWDELKALSAKIVADGNGSPWCIGILDGAATGWIATDWLEDAMLRTAGIEKYNQWISHELPFDSPEVRAALDVLAEQWFTDGYVNGGYQAITATDRLEGWDPMFAPDNNWDGFTPGCWMHRQSTWIGPDFFPDKRANSDPNYQSMYVLGEDIGMFYLPPIDAAQGSPVLVAGDTLMVPTPAGGAEVRPEVKAVAQFLATPYGPKAWIDIGSGIAANSTTPADWYQSYKQGVAGDIVTNANAVGFDASDLMPPAVGAGTFWSKMVEWIDAGGSNTDQILSDIDASWPTQ
jgi:alpha-glucoside transport system substrate-binding protein